MAKCKTRDAVDRDRILPEGWVQEAAEAEDWRDYYRRMLTTPLPGDPKAAATELSQLLSDLCKLRGALFLVPEVQQDLYARCQCLFAGIIEATLPSRRANAKLPPPDAVAGLVAEAEVILGMRTALAVVRSNRSISRGGIARSRRQLVDVWVDRNMPLSSTPREIKAARERCIEALANLTERAARAPRDAARTLVASLLGSSSEMVKKLEKRRSAKGGRTR